MPVRVLHLGRLDRSGGDVVTSVERCDKVAGLTGEVHVVAVEAEAMIDVILDTHRDYLPQFFG